MPYLNNGEPMCVLWVGNFYRPEYNSEKAMAAALQKTKELGFNGFVLDSKQWEDFNDYYNDREPSQYVTMQLFAISRAKTLGLHQMFLAVYLSGDNLYSIGLRESPPILVDRPVGYDGERMPTYRYWSEKTQNSMVTHIKGLIDKLGDNHLEVSNDGSSDLLPMVTMFEPWIVPSFDRDGQERYIGWLEKRYGSIDEMNRRYGTVYKAFSEVRLEDCWYGAEKFAGLQSIPPAIYCDPESSGEPDEKFLMYVDNQLWRADEYAGFFRDIAAKLEQIETKLYKMPILNQWQMFFGSGRYWNNVCRGIDPWKIGPYIDSCTFNTLPSDMFFQPNPYVISTEISVSRSASSGADFVAGLDICRFVENDVYRFCPPSEVIATTVLQGAQGLHVYGYNGLDDGGSLKRMPEFFTEDVKKGVAFFKDAARTIRGKKRKKEAAILYPLWLSLIQPYSEGRMKEKADFLGWYQYLCDLGYHADILHPDQICNGQLGEYKLLILPYEPYYSFDRRADMETMIRNWVEDGGLLVHGSCCGMLENIADVGAKECNYQAIVDKAYLLPLAFGFETFKKGSPLVYYKNGDSAAVENTVGKGRVFSIGFNPGLAYISPRQWVDTHDLGMNELYQFCLFEETFLSRYLKAEITPFFPGTKGVECALFEDIAIVVNHNSWGAIINIPDIGERTIPPHGYFATKRAY